MQGNLGAQREPTNAPAVSVAGLDRPVSPADAVTEENSSVVLLAVTILPRKSAVQLQALTAKRVTTVWLAAAVLLVTRNVVLPAATTQLLKFAAVMEETVRKTTIA